MLAFTRRIGPGHGSCLVVLANEGLDTAYEVSATLRAQWSSETTSTKLKVEHKETTALTGEWKLPAVAQKVGFEPPKSFTVKIIWRSEGGTRHRHEIDDGEYFNLDP